jgi:transposase
MVTALAEDELLVAAELPLLQEGTRTGFESVHVKSAESQEARALLVARKQLQHKLNDIELSIRGILRGFGLKVGKITRNDFEKRIRELIAGHAMLEQIADAMLSARAALRTQFNKLHKAVLDIVRRDEVCRRFMTTPSVGAIVAITYKSALDDPHRIKKSRNGGSLFGLTPSRYQSGETDVTGGITRVGDEMVRAALYEAANVLLSRVSRFSALKRWGLQVAKRRGLDDLNAVVLKITQNKSRYIYVEGATRVPWFFVGIFHAVERSLNFNTHLHNGDPLTQKTVHVPRGRPVNGDPPFTWEESAIDDMKSFSNLND